MVASAMLLRMKTVGLVEICLLERLLEACSTFLQMLSSDKAAGNEAVTAEWMGSENTGESLTGLAFWSKNKRLSFLVLYKYNGDQAWLAVFHDL